mgnify:CR=1 FL=1|tara:strand:- start:51 stop:602 length:552 start_codon:yes stop_codon:yes gene_type:complete
MTTDSQDIDIQEMMRDAEEAEEPGNIKAGEALSGTSEGMTMTTAELRSAGYVYVYDSRTGDRSVVNRNMLPGTLLKKRADGSYVFSTKIPNIKIHVGEIKCPLHPDDENREKYDAYGFITCPKSDFRTLLDRDRHMQSRHKRAFATLQNELARESKESELLERRALTETLKAMNRNNSGGKNG